MTVAKTEAVAGDEAKAHFKAKYQELRIVLGYFSYLFTTCVIYH